MAAIDWPRQDVQEVADGVVAIVQGHGESGVANAGFVASDGDGGGGRASGEALVVDTMMFPEMAAGIVDALGTRRLRPATVLNTHHHIDHIGGNVVFADARLVAHPASIHTIETGGHPVGVYDAFMSQFAGRFADMELVTPAPLEDAGAKLDLPRDAELLPFVPAHTPADVAVWVPGSRTLFTGDLCFFGVTPLAIQGLVSSWVAALDALLALEPDAVVPGHGPVGTAADITVARDYLAALVEHGRAAVDAGAELDDAVSEFRFGPGSDWPESERTLVNLERAMQEARGEISAVDLSALPPSFARLLS